MSHPALARGSLAIISGGASGIGLAAAQRWASLGLSVGILDRASQTDLDSAIERISSSASGSASSEKYKGWSVDVSDREAVKRVADEVRASFEGKQLTVLQANAGTGGGTKVADWDENWERILNTNLYGVIHIVQAFLPLIQAHSQPAAIINTGSKQGITCPPGTGPAYNISKAGVKVFTEQLAHEVRASSSTRDRVSVHLLIPGWVHTGLTGAKEGKSKPDGAWSPEQTVDYLVKEGLEKKSFYVLCPDNETSREMDLKRIKWNVEDMTQDRPALSRWHDEWKDKFDEYMK
ncbi:NAD(P)-binding protein [Ceraceosorus guamensis]|uniref:NAD(P)-binding protein n=1 Tax=Ceraceosorus guamensis TaxID=1522189 RepID=A0A316W7Y9_9BASI|nr:NAD(P)-binding protein [Ceraceosorus guamensis]PWN43785.1 NAD(P)-binding protein [Ceraceosorus guamensis]